MPGDSPSAAGRTRRVVTVSGPTADHLDRLSDRLGTRRPETIARALNCLDFLTSLGEDDDLLVRNRRTGETERVRFQ